MVKTNRQQRESLGKLYRQFRHVFGLQTKLPSSYRQFRQAVSLFCDGPDIVAPFHGAAKIIIKTNGKTVLIPQTKGV